MHCFVRPDGPLGSFAEEYRGFLAAAGYGFGAVQHRNTQLAEISRWLASEGLGAGEFSEAQGGRFIASRLAAGRVTWTSPASTRLPLAFLRSVGAVPPAGGVVGLFDGLLDAYRLFLFNERGLIDKTVMAHLGAARRFCAEVAGGPGGLAVWGPGEVTAYVLAVCRQRSVAWVTSEVGALRSWLGYLHVSGITASPLAFAVPKVAGRRAGLQPPGLSTDELARLLASCDRRRDVGRRDYAILMLLSRLGLRAGEVVALTLDDIDWHHGEFIVRGKGNRHERLPLPREVGAAVAGYLQWGRPKWAEGYRAVFVRAKAPWTPLALSGVQTVVADASRRAGMDRVGPRRLRHSAATRMHRAGMPLSAVAEVLRHRDTRVTTVYVDVEQAALGDLARPWPGSDQ
jgi:integrase/recombinase XerD